MRLIVPSGHQNANSAMSPEANWRGTRSLFVAVHTVYLFIYLLIYLSSCFVLSGVHRMLHRWIVNRWMTPVRALTLPVSVVNDVSIVIAHYWPRVPRPHTTRPHTSSNHDLPHSQRNATCHVCVLCVWSVQRVAAYQWKCCEVKTANRNCCSALVFRKDNLSRLGGDKCLAVSRDFNLFIYLAPS